MKRIITLLFTLLIICTNVLSAQDLTSADYNLLDSLLETEYHNQPGVVVFAAKGDDIIFYEGYGLSNISKRTHLAKESIFEIGSMTKQFTSLAVLLLVEEGLINLDEPIQKYIPDFPVKIGEIIIHHLLSQTSGLPEFFDVDEEEYELLSTEHSPSELLSYFKDLPLNFEPGSRFQYSNSNYPILGLIIERVSGKSLKEYFEKSIFEPLDMNNTSLWYKDNYTVSVPQGYRKDRNLGVVKSPLVVGSTVYAAGGIVSTQQDLFKWNREISNPVIYKKRIIKQLTKENRTNTGSKTGYGYGFYLRDFHGQKSIEHGGLMYGFSSTAMYLPKNDIYVCVLSNMAFENTRNIAQFVAARIIDKDMPFLRNKPTEELVKYTGLYNLVNQSVNKKVELKIYEGQLILHFPNNPQSDAILYYINGEKFTSKDIELELVFKLSPSGSVLGFAANQGEVFEFEKER